MKTPIFTGSSVAICTPMHNDGQINFEELARLIEFQIKNGTDCITICGTTGESATLNDKEQIAAIEFTVKTVAGRIPVVAGAGSNDTAHSLYLAQAACAAGADGLLVVTPYYNKTTQRGLVKHYEYLADRVNKPIIIYNVPGRTGMSCAAATYKALSAHPMINGVKEASGNFTLIAATRALCGDDLFLWSGNDDQTVALMSLGGLGVISVAANIVPGAVHEMTAKYLSGDTRGAMEMQLAYFDLDDTLFCEVNPIPVKTALSLMGFNMGPLRLPLYEMSESNLERLKVSMKKMGLL